MRPGFVFSLDMLYKKVDLAVEGRRAPRIVVIRSKPPHCLAKKENHASI